MREGLCPFILTVYLESGVADWLVIKEKCYIMDLLPSKYLTKEFMEELLREPEVLGVIFNFFTRTDKIPPLPKSMAGRKDANLVFLSLIGAYGLKENGEKFANNIPPGVGFYHILRPSLTPDFTCWTYHRGRRALVKMSQEMMKKYYLESSGNVAVDFALKNIYNLYIYYLSVGAFPFLFSMGMITDYLVRKDYDLPSSSPEEYFEALFSYVRLYAFEVSNEDELYRYAISSIYLHAWGRKVLLGES